MIVIFKGLDPVDFRVSAGDCEDDQTDFLAS